MSKETTSHVLLYFIKFCVHIDTYRSSKVYHTVISYLVVVKSKLLNRGAVDDLMHYCTRLSERSSMVPRGNSLTIL